MLNLNLTTHITRELVCYICKAHQTEELRVGGQLAGEQLDGLLVIVVEERVVDEHVAAVTRVREPTRTCTRVVVLFVFAFVVIR